MRLGVKSKNGKLEVFDGVDNWSFAELREKVAAKFNLRGNFSLLFGTQELPSNDSKIIESKLGFVSGDRLRLVLKDENLPNHEQSLASDDDESRTGEENTDSDHTERINELNEEKDIKEIVVSEMKREGFECVDRTNENRIKFKHSKSLLYSEVDFRSYEDLRSNCVHITASIIHPAGRHFLDPVVVRQSNKEARTIISQHIVSTIKISLLGHSNPFLKLLGQFFISKQIFGFLSPKSFLRLEQTSKYSLDVCRNEQMDSVWRDKLKKEFGNNADKGKSETYRDSYKRRYIAKMERHRRRARELEYEHHMIEERRNLQHVPFRIPHPEQPIRPQGAPDPDMPHGPLTPDPENPYLREDPFPGLPLPGPSRRNPRNLLDPLSGGELLPSRPTRPRGLPRQLPGGSHHDNGGNFI